LFISYRVNDSQLIVDRLKSDFGRKYGKRNVFLDKRDLVPADPYPDTLGDRLIACNIVISIIGNNWDGGLERFGYPRILDGNDWVRQEVNFAINNRKLIVVNLCGPRDTVTPRVPEYGDGELEAWKKVERYQLLRKLQTIQGIPLGDGDRYDDGIAEINKAILRRHGDGHRLLLWLWRWLGLPLIVLMATLLGILNYREQQWNHEKIDNLTNTIASLQPVVVLPYDFEQFDDMISRVPPDAVLDKYSGAYVLWNGVYVRSEFQSKDETAVYLTGKSGEEKRYIKARILTDRFRRDWTGITSGNTVRFVGRIVGYEPMTGEIRLRDVQRYKVTTR
jgi:hypothetical protein